MLLLGVNDAQACAWAEIDSQFLNLFGNFYSYDGTVGTYGTTCNNGGSYPNFNSLKTYESILMMRGNASDQFNCSALIKRFFSLC